MQDVLRLFGVEAGAVTEPFGSGLIHHTWKVSAAGKQYILQKVNQDVFAEPGLIAHNIKLLSDYLVLHHPHYTFVAPVPSNNGSDLAYIESQGFFRMFPFVAGSHSRDIVETPAQAYEAAAQFGRFTKVLSSFDVNQLKITIPAFHDLDLRYRQFLTAVRTGNEERLYQSKELIGQLKDQADIVDSYRALKQDPSFRLRVTHHDTKISNVLFDENDQGICVIDLDTVMPGYFISDIGDMMRTFLSPVSEEEQDFCQIEIRDAFYEAIVQGYSSELKGELTLEERAHFFYAGKFMIYMQALRFVTDHLNNDLYYGAKYEGQNFIRAGNQVVLLQRLMEKEATLKRII